MTIYGVGLLALCYLAGQLAGEVTGDFLGIDANVGGVGFAMLLLIASNRVLERRGILHEQTRKGIAFWENLYIPIIVAMAATLNVRVALEAGYLALLAGAIPVVAMYGLVPLLRKSLTNQDKDHDN